MAAAHCLWLRAHHQRQNQCVERILNRFQRMHLKLLSSYHQLHFIDKNRYPWRRNYHRAAAARTLSGSRLQLSKTGEGQKSAKFIARNISRWPITSVINSRPCRRAPKRRLVIPRERPVGER